MTHAERLAKLKTFIMQASADELRVLLLVVERLAANRQQNRIDVQIPRDVDGELTAALQNAVDLSLSAVMGLARARERRP